MRGATPCRRICRQEPRAGFCIGCGRTVAEIFGWIDLGEDGRQRVLAELPRRLASLPASEATAVETDASRAAGPLQM